MHVKRVMGHCAYFTLWSLAKQYSWPKIIQWLSFPAVVYCNAILSLTFCHYSQHILCSKNNYCDQWSHECLLDTSITSFSKVNSVAILMAYWILEGETEENMATEHKATSRREKMLPCCWFHTSYCQLPLKQNTRRGCAGPFRLWILKHL